METTQAEISWDPPRGDFTKYTLIYDRVSRVGIPANVSKPSLTRLISKTSNQAGAAGDSTGSAMVGPPGLVQDPAAGLASNSIIFCFLFVHKINDPLFVETLFSSVPPSNSLVSVSDP